MVDQINNSSGAPGGSPGGNASAATNNAANNTGGSYVRTRAAQMAATMQPPAQDRDPAAQPDAQQPPPQQQQQQPPAEAIMRFADGSEFKESDLRAMQARDAEAASRKATLPSSPDGYEVKLPDGFQAPEGVRFEFDTADPALKSARELAHKHGISPDVFQQMLGVYASTKMGEAIRNAQLRDVNMRQLGAAGPQRIEAVATWLAARTGREGQAMGNMLRQFPAVALVKGFEAIIRQFSNQGGADYSGQHRESADAEAGKSPATKT